MPRQNRVIPFGERIATEARGQFMGNRGVLHVRLIRTGRLWTWSPSSSAEGEGRDPRLEVEVLTPRSTVNAIRAGYSPEC